MAFLPGVTVLTFIYFRTWRLPSLIFSHWSLDAFAILLTLTF
jgi:membrane protease YdiL (CAAX protease family)